MKNTIALALAVACSLSAADETFAQTPVDPAVTACKSTGLIAIKQTSSDVTDLVIDMKSLAINKADTKVEDVTILNWKTPGPRSIRWIEGAAAVTAEVVSVSTVELVLEVNSEGSKAVRIFRAAKAPHNCPSPQN